MMGMSMKAGLAASPARPAAAEMKRADLQGLRASEAGTFEGYASVFGVVDAGRDVVAPGAFAASLKKRGASGVKMLWQHQAAEPIGVWTQITEDGHGLKVKGRLDLSVARAREALSLLRQGAVDGLSIGFRTKRAVADRQSGIRKLLEIDLWEISVVTFPMLTQARVDAVKRTALRPPRQRRSATLDAVRLKLARLRAQTAAINFEFKLLRLARKDGEETSEGEDQLALDLGGGGGGPGGSGDGGICPKIEGGSIDGIICLYKCPNGEVRSFPSGPDGGPNTIFSFEGS